MHQIVRQVNPPFTLIRLSESKKLSPTKLHQPIFLNIGIPLQQTKSAAGRSRVTCPNSNLSSQTSIDCWAKMPAIAPCHDAVVTEGKRGLVRSPAA
jgi:hypothetical protein